MSAGGFIPIVTDGTTYQLDAANKLSFSDESLDIVDSNIKLHWDFSKITGLNNLDDILSVPDQSGNGYTGTSAVGEEFVFLENYTEQNLSVGDDVTSANGVQTSSYSADGILELLIMYSTFDYSNGNRFSMPTSISPLVNGITLNHTTTTTFRSVNKWQGTATQETSTWTIPDQSIDSLHIYALKISVSNKLMELFVDGVSYGTKPINASATAILATLGDTYIGHGQTGATGSGNINYGEMFVAEGVYSSSKIIEYSNRLTNKWGGLITKNIAKPTETGTFTNGASVVDSAYSFDGVNDYIDLGNTIDLTDTHTISCWAKPESFGKILVGVDAGFSSCYYFYMLNPTRIYVNRGGDFKQWDISGFVNAMVLGEWLYFVAVRNGLDTSFYLYRNTGRIPFSQSNPQTHTTNLTPLTLESLGRSRLSANYFQGSIADLNISVGKTLTEAEILKNYEATKHRFQ